MSVWSATALAAPPQITSTSFSDVTETSATLQASVDPTGVKTAAHFEYTPLATYEEEGVGFTGAQGIPAEPILVPAKVTGTGRLKAGISEITGVLAGAGAFGPGQSISASSGLQPGTTVTAVEPEAGGTLKLQLSKNATADVASASLEATGPQPLSVPIAGLNPATGYVFRLVAKKTAGLKEEAQSEPPVTLYTFSEPPSFAPCPNEEFRSGVRAAPGAPAAQLPDCRSYELASPLEKNGNDVLSAPGLARAAADGAAITFGSSFGMPGTLGAQEFPFYQAYRSEGGGQPSWTSSGLLPPASAGEEAYFLVGELPDLSSTYALARHRDKPETDALFEIHRDGTPPTQITPYMANEVSGEDISFIGASADASTLLIESFHAYPEQEGGQPLAGARAGAPNIYAWDRAGATLHLASVMNTPEATEEALAKGASANYYLEDHAVSSDGSVFFTSLSTGHLYERLHPTRPQSALDGEGHCTEATKACTIDISATHKTNGGAAHDGPDPAGEQPAAFQAATPNGSDVFFTSSEKLTNDANTGPEQPPAQIGRATLNGEEPATETNESFLPAHAIGVAVDPKGEYIYWADPTKETIARARLDASGNLVPNSTEDEFIVPGEGECPQVVKDAELLSGGIEIPPVFEQMPIPSKPRYVAVDEGHVYWTNTGREQTTGPQIEQGPIDGGGTIGRATLNPDHSATEGEVEPDFICGVRPNQSNPNGRAERLVSNPQGIAVDSEHVYWANHARTGAESGIARAAITGDEADPTFAAKETEVRGLALSGTNIYAGLLDENNHYVVIKSFAVGGEHPGAETANVALGHEYLRGLASDGTHLYWAEYDPEPARDAGGREVTAKRPAIGSIALSEMVELAGGACLDHPTCHQEFLVPAGTAVGLATTANHLLWSTNGESPPNPGADLYRYEAGAAEPLTDLTPDPSVPNGAEVQGVLGTSADGSYVYFAANADLDGGGPALAGDCGGGFSSPTGECNIYLAHDGTVRFIDRIAAGGGEGNSGVDNWLLHNRSSRHEAKTSWVSADGQTLVFASAGNFYRFHLGEEGVTCVSCRPTGEGGPVLSWGLLGFYSTSPSTGLSSVQDRRVADEGNRVFFETTAALVPSDIDGDAGCPLAGGPLSGAHSCLDVYEWEAPGTGSCVAGAPGYSPLNGGCLYLISQGSGSDPAFFADASASGNDVFFYTRAQLVGSDTDGLRDAYDARVEGGLASQNPIPSPPCEAEGCRPAPTPAPEYQAPPHFSGPPNPKPKRCGGKKCKKPHHHRRRHHKKHHRRHGGAR